MKFTCIATYGLILALLLQGCNYNQNEYIPEVPPGEYTPLPENLIAYNNDSTLNARYVDPTKRYNHGVLGDTVEAEGLLVIRQGTEYYYKLEEQFVFEDLQPRLFDVDLDGELEFITIQTSLDLGASVSIYKIMSGKLLPFLKSDYIGTTKRWLNIAAINDLDNDGNVEIAWVQTPHIGGILKVARVENGAMDMVAEKAGVSNHRYGFRNLCLSAITLSNGIKHLWLPNDPFSGIIEFQLLNDQIISLDTIIQMIDPAIPLFMQHAFAGYQEDKSCIFVP